MAMRYIVVPKPRNILKYKGDPKSPEPDGTRSFSYFDMMREFVWSRPEWRKDEVHASAFNRVFDAHEEAEANGLPFIELSGADYDIFAPFATLQGVQFTGPNVPHINRLSQCVTFATSTKPDTAPKQEPTPEQAASPNGAS